MRISFTIAVALALTMAAAPRAQESPVEAARRSTFDQILDTNVRDGFVYCRALTLDQIEQTVLPEFKDPRIYFALGRGSVGGGRLKSEAFAAATLESQLASVAAECATRGHCIQVDRTADKLLVSPIFSWREK